MVKDKVESVLGPIEPNELQRTLTHEHVSLDFVKHLVPASEVHQSMVNCPFTLENLNWIRHNPYSHAPNMVLCNETEAVVGDLKSFKKAGGSTIVENSSIGLSRDVKKMKYISEQTGVHIVCGTGYYVERQLTDEMKAQSVEQMTQVDNLMVFVEPLTSSPSPPQQSSLAVTTTTIMITSVISPTISLPF
jgi:phosphotriesterase-related protein